MDNTAELNYIKDLDRARVSVELEAADSLGVLLKRVGVEFARVPADAPAALRRQAAAIVEKLGYLDTLKVIEVDGVSNAVQIRSAKPSDEGFVEIILRGGHSLTLERRGAALHISRTQLDRLLHDLSAL